MKFTCKTHTTLLECILPNSSTPNCLSTHGLDEYSFLHLLVGTGANVYFPKTKFNKLLLGHLFWEYLETRKDFRNLLFNGQVETNGSTIKYEGDSFVNFFTDNLAFYLGHKLQKKINLDKKEFILIFILSNYLASKSSLYRFG